MGRPPVTIESWSRPRDVPGRELQPERLVYLDYGWLRLGGWITNQALAETVRDPRMPALRSRKRRSGAVDVAVPGHPLLRFGNITDSRQLTGVDVFISTNSERNYAWDLLVFRLGRARPDGLLPAQSSASQPTPNWTPAIE